LHFWAWDVFVSGDVFAVDGDDFCVAVLGPLPSAGFLRGDGDGVDTFGYDAAFAQE